jgi:hypothetical protein
MCSDSSEGNVDFNSVPKPLQGRFFSRNFEKSLCRRALRGSAKAVNGCGNRTTTAVVVLNSRGCGKPRF